MRETQKDGGFRRANPSGEKEGKLKSGKARVEQRIWGATVAIVVAEGTQYYYY